MSSLILRDWRAREARDMGDYPKHPFPEIPVEMWTLEEAWTFLRERVKLHQAAREGTYPPCSDDDRWMQQPSWAVQKPGAKRAYRVFNSQFKANQFQAQAGAQYIVVHRPGENIRCARYCPVVSWCTQAKALGVTKEEVPE